MNLDPKHLVKLLLQNGFVLKRVKGSHHIFHNPATNKTTIVPMHAKELPKGTFYTILKQAGIDKKSI